MIYALPPPGAPDHEDRKRALDLAAAEQRLHVIEERLARLQADYKIQRAHTWSGIERRLRERRRH